ncbi:hypothetical protein DOTSEDRAFT_55687 [Dothistroma septosporum NZE10]|uniref:2EXR domain-containing protein n=1 Tax=Dothistroma septosporum (strain NZE10 / CBS 128990) TaxID=675120 RepID=N1PD13_DOTSN|nr:hypothetical protein DOTSEDRAFT_55687 [Dothistroma septosporum NZE10]
MESADSEPCHFLRLPPELRNEIYELVIYPQQRPAAHRSRAAIRRQEHDDVTPLSFYGYDISPYTIPSMLATHRQIRAEAGGVFYSRTLFCTRCGWKGIPSSALSMLRWLRSLEIDTQKLIKSLRIEPYESLRSKGLKSHDARVIIEHFAWALSDDENVVFKLPIVNVKHVTGYKYLSVIAIQNSKVEEESSSGMGMEYWGPILEDILPTSMIGTTVSQKRLRCPGNHPGPHVGSQTQTTMTTTTKAATTKASAETIEESEQGFL